MAEKNKTRVSGKNFIGGLVEGYNYPKGKQIPLLDVLECKDLGNIRCGY